MTGIRDHLAKALHEGRDHTRDGCKLGDEPICNCYTLTDKVIAALGGVKDEREFGTVLRGGEFPILQLDYRHPAGGGYVTPNPQHVVRERIGYATEWQPLTEVNE